MLEPSSAEVNRSTPCFTGLPPEIRHQIYSYLLISPKPLRIEVAQIPHHRRPFTPPSTSEPSTASNTPNPTIKPHSLTSQLLCVSRLTHTEALPLLYTHNTYDVTARSSLHTLTLTLPPPHFHLITTLTLDWDSLQDFSFQLAKPTFLSLLSSLTTLNLATWRTRILSSQSAFLWRDVQSYERTICTAALLITQRHPRLALVAQRRWIRQLGGRSKEIVRRNLLRQQAAEAVGHAIPPGQTPLASTSHSPLASNVTSSGSGGGGEGTVTNGSGSSSSNFMATANTVNTLLKRSVEENATTRIKWRFVASKAQLDEEEELMDLEGEVAKLMEQCRPENEGPGQMALDPI